MDFRSAVMEMVIYVACFLPIGIVIVLTMWWLSDNAKVYQPVANEVANGVANEIVVNSAVITTETGVYKIVCVAPADTFCKEYSVRKINRE